MRTPYLLHFHIYTCHLILELDLISSFVVIYSTILVKYRLSTCDLNDMDRLQQCLGELRYLFYHLRYDKRADYVKYGSVVLIECLQNVALNFMYSNKNNIDLSSIQIKTLRKHKKAILRLVMAKDTQAQRKALNNKLIDVLLTIFMSISKKLKLE